MVEKKVCVELPVGGLYLFEFSREKGVPIYQPLQGEITGKPSHPKIPYDADTGNVHLLPANLSLAEECSEFIHKVGNEIRYYFKDLNSKDIKLQKQRLPYAKMLENSRYIEAEIYKEAKFLFSYVDVLGKKTGTQYDLVFNRFFVDDNNHVNCILLCPQIKMYEKGNEPKSIEYYPDTSKPDKGNTVYYNLDVDIHDSSEKIAKAFLEFVRKKENERA